MNLRKILMNKVVYFFLSHCLLYLVEDYSGRVRYTTLCITFIVNSEWLTLNVKVKKKSKAIPVTGRGGL
jgi:hypothetical protein